VVAGEAGSGSIYLDGFRNLRRPYIDTTLYVGVLAAYDDGGPDYISNIPATPENLMEAEQKLTQAGMNVFVDYAEWDRQSLRWNDFYENEDDEL